MPKQSKKRTKRSPLSRADILGEIQKIHPFLHSNIVTLLRRASSLFGFFAFVLGNTAFVALILATRFNNNTLSFALTRPSSALSFILLGLGILLLNLKKRNTTLIIIIAIFSLLSLFIDIACLVSYLPFFQQLVYPIIPIFGYSDIDFFFHLAPNAAIILICSSFSLLLFLSQKEKIILIGQFFILLGILLVLPSNIGYFYGSNFIYSVSTSTKLAISTTLGLNAITIGLLFSRSAYGLMKVITQPTTGGFFARRFIPIAIISPLILGWIWLAGYHLNLYKPEFQYLLLITSIIVIFLLWTFYITNSIQKLDASRRAIQRNIIFLSEASKILSSSLDYRATLRKIAELAVPIFADWCTVEMVNDQNEVHQVAIAHLGKRKKSLAIKLFKNRSFYTNEKSGLHRVLTSGKAELYPLVTNDLLTKNIADKTNLKIAQKLQIHSAMIVPITIHNRTVGVIQFMLSRSTNTYTASDLQVAQELTSRAALAIENTMLYKNAQDAIKIRDEFISIASHELKTPLTTLKVYAEVLLKKFMKLDPKTAEYLQKMDDQITNMTNLIKDLLDVSRIQVGKLAFHFERVQVGDLVKDIITNFQPTTRHKITLQGSITQLIIADRERIGQVVLNLLTNAVKYSPQVDKVVVTLSQNKNGVGFDVQDFGIGIDKKHAQKIFERFYQVGSKKQANAGLGMGLYITKEIVERHGGTITVESSKGKGTTFSVTLPTQPPKLG